MARLQVAAKELEKHSQRVEKQEGPRGEKALALRLGSKFLREPKKSLRLPERARTLRKGSKSKASRRRDAPQRAVKPKNSMKE